MNHTEEIRQVREAIGQVFVGKQDTVRTLLTGFVSGLHVLIEDVPGVGKTTLAKSLAAAAGMDFSRIQFTPDLLPGDITGMTIWDQEKKDFVYKSGAIMHQFVLADEINRASPRTQSSLLEAMQDESVSVDGRTYRLPDPFFVVATQNPSDFIGAFHLPEGELDRFGLAVSIGYPLVSEEKLILDRFRLEEPLDHLKPILTPQQVAEIRAEVRNVKIADAVAELVIQIANKTRGNRHIRLGASPRASLHLQIAAQGCAFMDGRAFVIPEDVMAMAAPVLAHRIILSAEARMENKSSLAVVAQVLKDCEIPTGIR